MVRLVGLDDGPSRKRSPTGTSDRLDEELVGALRRPLVGKIEGDVRRDDADQRDRRDIEALGDQARPDQDIEPALGEGIDDALRGPAVLDHVTVQTTDAQSGERLADLALDAFGPAAEIADARRPARWAARRERGRPTAVVTAQRRPGLVIDERPLAVRAGLDIPAIAAEHDRRGPAAIEDEDRLFAASHVETGQRRRQGARQESPLPHRELLPKIHHLDRWCLADRPLSLIHI